MLLIKKLLKQFIPTCIKKVKDLALLLALLKARKKALYKSLKAKNPILYMKTCI